MSEQITWLIRLSRAPYHDELFTQALDIALACGAFGQSVAVVLEGAALGAVNPDQCAPAQEANVYKLLSAMPLYDIYRIYRLVHENTGTGGPTIEQLADGTGNPAPHVIEDLIIDTIDTEGWHTLLANAKHVLSF